MIEVYVGESFEQADHRYSTLAERRRFERYLPLTSSRIFNPQPDEDVTARVVDPEDVALTAIVAELEQMAQFEGNVESARPYFADLHREQASRGISHIGQVSASSFEEVIDAAAKLLDVIKAAQKRQELIQIRTR